MENCTLTTEETVTKRNPTRQKGWKWLPYRQKVFTDKLPTLHSNCSKRELNRCKRKFPSCQRKQGGPRGNRIPLNSPAPLSWAKQPPLVQKEKL
jgi:hypothetical protein